MSVPTFSLDTGALIPEFLGFVDLAVNAGELPGFASHGEGNHIYCAVVRLPESPLSYTLLT